MPNIRESHEAKRGCGYRKGGGLYLVSGALNRPCGKLPAPMHVCPTCSQGIKPTRGFTWINAKAIFAGITCTRKDTTDISSVVECVSCVCGNMAAEHGGLLWIGGSFYENSEIFSLEAATQGISRRIAMVPRGFKVGETVVYLAHRKVPTLQDTAGIFAAFIPSAIEYVVKGTESDEELESIEKRGISLVKVTHDPEPDDTAKDTAEK